MINGMLQIADSTITLKTNHHLEIFARIFNKALHCSKTENGEGGRGGEG